MIGAAPIGIVPGRCSGRLFGQSPMFAMVRAAFLVFLVICVLVLAVDMLATDALLILLCRWTVPGGRRKDYRNWWY
jgi:hypothetical protein